MKKLLLSLGLGLLASATASASVITYEHRATNAGADKSDYLASWENQTSTIYSSEIESFTHMRPASSNRHSHLSFTFDVAEEKAGQSWWFQIAPDAGSGGAVYFNNDMTDYNRSDLWWGYNWNRSYELLDTYVEDLTAGTHTLDAYWIENCCNGYQAARFSVDQGETWYALSNENLQAVGVPEPGTMALLGLGVIGLIGTRKMTRK